MLKNLDFILWEIGKHWRIYKKWSDVSGQIRFKNTILAVVLKVDWGMKGWKQRGYYSILGERKWMPEINQ